MNHLCIAFVASVLGAIPASAADQTWTGKISDNMCARNARRNSGLRCNRQSVTGDMPSAAAAFSCVPCSNKAAIACSARRVSRRRLRLGVILASPCRRELRPKLHRMFVHPPHAGRSLPCSAATDERSRPRKEDQFRLSDPAGQSSRTQSP
jgi:hypothetical protein